MRHVIDSLIVTSAADRRVIAWCKHRQRRIRKKWSRAVICRPQDLDDVQGAMDAMRHLARYVEVTERCERQVARFLRRSGYCVVVLAPAERAEFHRTGVVPRLVRR